MSTDVSRARVARFLATYGFRAAPHQMTASLVLLTGMSIVPVGIAYGSKLFVDGLIQQDRSGMTAGITLVSVLFVGIWGVGIVAATLLVPLGDRVRLHVTTMVARLTTSAPTLEHFERPDYLRELKVLQVNTHVLAAGPQDLILLVGVVVRVVALGLVLATLHPLLAVVPLLGAVPALTEWWSVRYRQRVEDQIAEDRRRADAIFSLASTVAPANEIRIYGLAGELAQRHEALTASILSRLRRGALVAFVSATAGWLVFTGGFIGGLALVVVRAAEGDLTAGDVVMTFALFQNVHQQLAQVAGFVGRILTTAAAVSRLFWLESYTADALRTSGAGVEPSPVPARLQHALELRGVSFRYPGADHDVLRDLDLRIPAGSVVAVVGENGAGKTTLVKLLTGLHRPSGGSITLDGVDLAGMDLAQWRARTTATFQDFMRYELTAGQNVGIGDLPRLDDDQAIGAALNRARGIDVVSTLPDGLATQLGRSFPDGRELSGGQWQKLALSRGMMRDEPLLLILDEPTASLDAQTEHALFEQYADAARRTRETTGAITLLISHRFSTVRMADLIVVLKDGCIHEVGTHQELMKRAGLYAELFTLQARAYA